MPAVPALIMAGGSIASAYMAKKTGESVAKSAMQRSPEEQALFSDSRRQASEMFGAGMPAIRSTLDYYKTLVDGSRSARMAAVSPEAQDVGAAFEGADKNAMNRLVGGERDQAIAENSRAKAGQVARLVTGARPAAAAGVAGLAAPLVGAGTNANMSLLGNSTQNRQMGNYMGMQAGSNTASAMGALIAQLASIYGKGKAGGWTGSSSYNYDGGG